MWKKIHSNRDPTVTVYSEIRKEFSMYFGKASCMMSRLVSRCPKILFAAMVLLILTSLILTFTVFRQREPVKKSPAKALAQPLSDGFDRIMEAGIQLKETIRLKKIVDSISAKKTLSHSDTLQLYKALDSLQHIHPTIK